VLMDMERKKSTVLETRWRKWWTLENIENNNKI
jgi:hypothetical protein